MISAQAHLTEDLKDKSMRFLCLGGQEGCKIFSVFQVYRDRLWLQKETRAWSSLGMVEHAGLPAGLPENPL